MPIMPLPFLVTLKGQSFKGFLILALKDNQPQGDPIGTFVANDPSQVDLVQDACPKNSQVRVMCLSQSCSLFV